jgi:4a-hydroxytetrahydrobiopterin dehydratase
MSGRQPDTPGRNRAGTDPTAPPIGAPLAAEPVAPCGAGALPLDEGEVARLAVDLPEWRVVERGGIARLERAFPMPSYRAALGFTQRVGRLAEAANHHPAILTEFGRVTVRWWTWTVRGLHRNDAVMAARTDRLFESMEWPEE